MRASHINTSQNKSSADMPLVSDKTKFLRLELKIKSSRILWQQISKRTMIYVILANSILSSSSDSICNFAEMLSLPPEEEREYRDDCTVQNKQESRMMDWLRWLSKAMREHLYCLIWETFREIDAIHKVRFIVIVWETENG